MPMKEPGPSNLSNVVPLWPSSQKSGVQNFTQFCSAGPH